MICRRDAHQCQDQAHLFLDGSQELQEVLVGRVGCELGEVGYLLVISYVRYERMHRQPSPRHTRLILSDSLAYSHSTSCSRGERFLCAVLYVFSQYSTLVSGPF